MVYQRYQVSCNAICIVPFGETAPQYVTFRNDQAIPVNLNNGWKTAWDNTYFVGGGNDRLLFSQFVAALYLLNIIGERFIGDYNSQVHVFPCLSQFHGTPGNEQFHATVYACNYIYRTMWIIQ